MLRFKIEVTKNHIERGIRGSCGNCPIALAMLEVIPLKEKYSLMVGLDAFAIRLMDIYNPAEDLQQSLPKKVKEFIRRFDYLEKVTPFSFSTPYIKEKYLAKSV